MLSGIEPETFSPCLLPILKIVDCCFTFIADCGVLSLPLSPILSYIFLFPVRAAGVLVTVAGAAVFLLCLVAAAGARGGFVPLPVLPRGATIVEGVMCAMCDDKSVR